MHLLPTIHKIPERQIWKSTKACNETIAKEDPCVRVSPHSLLARPSNQGGSKRCHKKICTRLGLFTLVPGFQNGSIHNQWDVSNRGLYRLTSLVSLLVCDGPRRDNRERPSV
eukprot:scaffold346_cov347-Pavlova_lutheri.AAC.9